MCHRRRRSNTQNHSAESFQTGFEFWPKNTYGKKLRKGSVVYAASKMGKKLIQLHMVFIFLLYIRIQINHIKHRFHIQNKNEHKIQAAAAWKNSPCQNRSAIRGNFFVLFLLSLGTNKKRLPHLWTMYCRWRVRTISTKSSMAGDDWLAADRQSIINPLAHGRSTETILGPNIHL